MQLSVAAGESFSLFQAGGPHVQGMLAENKEFFSLTMPTTGSVSMGGGKELLDMTSATAHVRWPDEPFRFRFHEKGRVRVLGFYRTDLDDFISGLNADLLDLAQVAPNVVSMNTPVGAALRRFLNYVWYECSNHDSQKLPAFADTIRNALLTMTVQVIDSADASLLLDRRDESDHAVVLAAEYISENFREPISLADIARAARRPIRSLTRAFRDRFGMSPMEMVRDRRLDASYEMLNAAKHGQMTVTDAAMDAGFGHLGRFTVYYRSKFGELPSETLARRRGI